MDIHRGSGPSRSGPSSPGSGFSVMPFATKTPLNRRSLLTEGFLSLPIC